MRRPVGVKWVLSKEQENKAIVRYWFTEFWGPTCNLDIVDELAAPDMLLQYSLHEPRRGHEDIKTFMSGFREALEVWGAADLIAEGDYVVGRWEGGGTHTGPAFADFLVGSTRAHLLGLITGQIAVAMVCDSRRIQQDEQRDTNGNHRERTEHWLRNGPCVANRVSKAEMDKGREQIKSVGKMIAPVHCMHRPYISYGDVAHFGEARSPLALRSGNHRPTGEHGAGD